MAWCKHVYMQQDHISFCLRTASPTHSRSIRILCYDLRVLWPAESTIKSHATLLAFWLLRDIDWNFRCLKSQSSSLNGCKTVDSESWRSKKIQDLLGSGLRFLQVYIVNCCSSSGPGSNPESCGLKWMIFSYFERSKLYLLK